jgi:hypothetical protein
VGLRWTFDAWTWKATLRLDNAGVTDLHSGGYVASTLWAATNDRSGPYGNSHGEPYVQLSISNGYRGKPGVWLVASQRKHNGQYFEAAERGFQLGTDYKVTLTTASQSTTTGTGNWKFEVDKPDGSLAEGTFTGTGRHPVSGSVFAGIETTSDANQADMVGSDLDFQEVFIATGGDFATQWGFAGHPDQLNPQLVRRGPGNAAWIDKFHSFRAHFGS